MYSIYHPYTPNCLEDVSRWGEDVCTFQERFHLGSRFVDSLPSSRRQGCCRRRRKRQESRRSWHCSGTTTPRRVRILQTTACCQPSGAVVQEHVHHVRHITRKHHEVMRMQKQIMHSVLDTSERTRCEGRCETEVHECFTRVLIHRLTDASVSGQTV
jgi:hypothetical protein